jgi:hypothetical protein
VFSDQLLTGRGLIRKILTPRRSRPSSGAYNPEGTRVEATVAAPRRHTPQPDRDQPAGAPDPEPEGHALYEIENPAEVDAYIVEHPTVEAILAEAPGEIRAVFGTDARPRLHLTCDPEEGDCWLSVRIPSADIGPSVLPLIDALDERWWLDRMPATDATVIFDVIER